PKIIRGGLRRHGPVSSGSPLVAGCARFAGGAHRVVAYRRLTLHAVIDAFQIMIEPAEHVRVHREASAHRVDQFADLVAILVTAVQPRSEQELLFAARVRPTVVLPANEALDRANAHEVVP